MWISLPFFVTSNSVDQRVVVLKNERLSRQKIFVLEGNDGFVWSHVFTIFLRHPVVKSVGLMHDDWGRVGVPVSKFSSVAADSDLLVSVDNWMEYSESNLEAFPFVFHVDSVGILISTHNLEVGSSVVGFIISVFADSVNHDVFVFEELR